MLKEKPDGGRHGSRRLRSRRPQPVEREHASVQERGRDRERQAGDRSGGFPRRRDDHAIGTRRGRPGQPAAVYDDALKERRAEIVADRKPPIESVIRRRGRASRTADVHSGGSGRRYRSGHGRVVCLDELPGIVVPRGPVIVDLEIHVFVSRAHVTAALVDHNEVRERCGDRGKIHRGLRARRRDLGNLDPAAGPREAGRGCR